jgi:hypothetical protein
MDAELEHSFKVEILHEVKSIDVIFLHDLMIISINETTI